MQSHAAGAFLVTGGDHYKDIIKTWQKVFGTARGLANDHLLDDVFESLDINRWDWSKTTHFCKQLAEDYSKTIKPTAAGQDGIHN